MVNVIKAMRSDWLTGVVAIRQFGGWKPFAYFKIIYFLNFL